MSGKVCDAARTHPADTLLLPRLVWLLVVSCASGSAADVPRELRDCESCQALVIVPAGRFIMGSDDGEPSRDEGPPREVRIAKPFALGRHEVTVGEFRRFAEATKHRVPPGCRAHVWDESRSGRVEWGVGSALGWADPGLQQPMTEDAPVVCVGRTDALAYAAWLRELTGKPYRLPSEAEWEYAARAGGSGAWSWGSNPDNGCRHANLYDRTSHARFDFGWSFADCEDGFAELAPVGRFAPNAFGLHDMHGNVWEWTADCYVERYVGAPSDGRALAGAADCQRFAVRGGGWMTRPGRQRLTFRGRDPNDARTNYFGFRVARDVGGEER